MISFLFLIISIGGNLFGQKQEVEKRIAAAEVPEIALQWIENLAIKKKRVRWYSEETSGKKSVEAKFIHGRRLYSIEFDTLGHLEDVEIMVKRNSLKPSQLAKIENTLAAKFDKYHLIKIQLQYTAKDVQLIKAFIEEGEETVTKRFEIEFEGKKDGIWRMYEGTFDEHGNLLAKREIIVRSTENLNY